MTEDKWLGIYLERRRWIERLAWTVLLLGSAAANTITTNLDIRRAHLPFEIWEPAVWEFSSALVWMVLIPWMVRAADTRPLRWGQLRRHLPWHLLFALLTSLAHVLGMVALRKLAYATQDARYDFGNWPVELAYEALKDVRSYAFILLIVGAYRLFVWRWQGEASLLAAAPGAPAVSATTAPATGDPATPASSMPSPEPASPADRDPEPEAARPERLLVKKLGKEFLLPVEEIEWVQACGNYVNLHRQQHDYPLRSSLGAFEQRLDPAAFVRVHRSYLVRLALIEAIEPTEAGDAHLRLRDGSRLPCSRTYLERLRQRLV
ncbi:LytTR family DNA-binding domain-containing protein [Mitsuaria sp. GD03876]|uniref:LytTR family DNA-binding domain-containing protein n=1 Tax=Mitsuaria sp. GD03876 TaxID=2975399 RepID=UPI002446CB38|nr:LytTR family DNA-binding domain-containing protein [Mitsuaria sp. GD03876]MDH0867031.1 LytTR family transcriptional regulator [Mitsuaria sp. GD03876]